MNSITGTTNKFPYNNKLLMSISKIYVSNSCGSSSIGRAPAFQAGGFLRVRCPSTTLIKMEVVLIGVLAKRKRRLTARTDGRYDEVSPSWPKARDFDSRIVGSNPTTSV